MMLSAVEFGLNRVPKKHVTTFSTITLQ